MKKHLLAILVSQIVATAANAESDYWHYADKGRNQLGHQKVYSLDEPALQQTLNAVGEESIELVLPLPTGEKVTFKLFPSQVMAPELAAKYSHIRTFTGVDKHNSAHRGHFNMDEKGFYGMFNYQGKHVYIDPQRNADNLYSVYDRTAKKQRVNPLRQQAPRRHHLTEAAHYHERAQSGLAKTTLPNTEIVYRLAVATTGEYAAYHGGTKEKVMSALVTMVNRLNDVYSRDMAIRFQLVEGSDKLIFLDSNSDPFDNTDADIDKISAVINEHIGLENYDVGHLVGTGGGGLAGFEVVCTEIKAEGVTGSEQPDNDAFHVDYVAHEIGHQLGAEHTFNGTSGACTGNRVGTSAYEPGSGSTIMGYAGICDEQNLQANSDPYFHAHSLEQMMAFTREKAGKSCGTHTPRANQRPEANAGNDYTIPARTPFKLIGSATDADGDTLSYSWQQYNVGSASDSKQSDGVDEGGRPLFRTFNPTDKAERTLPQISDVLLGTLSYGEAYATTTRKLDFRLVARDGKGGVSEDDMQVSVVANDAGFAVKLPDASSQWRTNRQLVNWHTAGSENAPVNCTQVDILLSVDGGQQFATTLASKVPNNGQYEVALPILKTDKARVMVRCSDNIFFAINKGDFSITNESGAAVKPKVTGQKPLTVAEDKPITVQPSDLTMATAQTIDSIEIAGGDNYTVQGTTITPKANFNGKLQAQVVVKRGEMQSDPFNLSITVTPVNDAPVAQNDTVSVEFGAQKVQVKVLDNDSDLDDDALKLTAVNYTGKGVVTFNEQMIIYSAPADFSGKEQVSYTVSDGQGATATGQLDVTVKEKTKVTDPTPTPEPTPPKNNDDTSSDSGSLWSLLGVMLLGLRRLRSSRV
ncbi:cadherin-like domain-containing protein [Pseudoalteromonas luteoviolacea]|uniref:reprolysin-like metallopeptidase n=1 Tax=Pseudoalteromonas luteoviolacea TaxID=43657 RepID=UPI001B3936EB|nr:zinc-dependent metalloprotease family protein [Pseudoalteromonas luteoviolacea]MBQ4813944.1 cadherin-like domain-containing protein [Pseudoalteromonas luteoviolacea]